MGRLHSSNSGDYLELVQRGAARSERPKTGQHRFAAALLAAVLWIMCAGHASPAVGQETHDLPEATSLISRGCFIAIGGDPETTNMGPSPEALSDACEASLAGDDGSMSTRASIRTEIPFAPRTGEVHAEAHSSHSLSGSTNSLATATVGGSVNIYVALHQKRRPPGAAPAVIPVVFQANGEGSVSGNNMFSSGAGDVAAGISSFELPTDAFTLRLDSSTASTGELRGSFDSEVTVNLEPWSPTAPNTYLIIVDAHCSAFSVPEVIPHQDAEPTIIPGRADCQVEVDSSIALDQFEFDKRMRGASFRLADYYEIVFSENVPQGDAAPSDGGAGRDAGPRTMDAGTSDKPEDHADGGCRATGAVPSDRSTLVALVLGFTFMRRRARTPRARTWKTRPPRWHRLLLLS